MSLQGGDKSLSFIGASVTGLFAAGLADFRKTRFAEKT